MPFDTFSSRLQPVALAGLKFCKNRYGTNGLRVEEEIDSNISWRPSFYMKPNPALIVAAEVSDSLYPGILKIAGHDVFRFDFPISILLVCPLDVFMADTKQTTIKQLKAHGFGIITVDEGNRAVLQHACIPLAQHLSEEELDSELSGLTPNQKVLFRGSHATYITNEGQGLQGAGQIVEALVNAIAKGAVSEALTSASILSKATADIIDELYSLKDFREHRAALGGARDFAKEYRNTVSHPARNAKQAIDKIRKCRSGFIDAIRISKNLYQVLLIKAYSSRINVT
ncbi:MAG TPA: hypothetical protein VJT81_15180 [Burkholderiales bacterium]|nr:hypothetical protein [Burkholderiales bacterium]